MCVCVYIYAYIYVYMYMYVRARMARRLAGWAADTARRRRVDSYQRNKRKIC